MNGPSALVARDQDPDRVWTAEAFLAADFGDARVELINGLVVVDQAAPTFEHGVLIGTLCHALINTPAKDRRCRTAAGAGVEIAAPLPGMTGGFVLVPDILMRCRDPEDGEEKPSLVVEVLSPSNTAKDLWDKLTAYKSLASMQDIVIVRQDRILVQHHARAEDGRWGTPLDLFGRGAVLRIDRLGLALALEDLYAGLFPAGEPENVGRPAGSFDLT